MSDYPSFACNFGTRSYGRTTQADFPLATSR